MSNNTSEFVQEYIKDNKLDTKQSGAGRKKNKKEELKNISYSEQLTTLNLNDTDEKSIPSPVEELSELSRMINNQATEIHDRSVKKIAELLKISEQDSKIFKAYIYNEVKVNNPELNNFDRAVEMEKKITKEYLTSLDKKKIEKLSEVIKAKYSEKNNSSEKSTEKKVKKTSTKKTSEKKSSKKLLSKTSNLSVTSISQK